MLAYTTTIWWIHKPFAATKYQKNKQTNTPYQVINPTQFMTWESLKIYQFTLSTNKYVVFEDIRPWLLQLWEVLGIFPETNCEEYHRNPKVAGRWEEFPSEMGNDPFRLSRRTREEQAKHCLLAVLVAERPPSTNRKLLKLGSKSYTHQFHTQKGTQLILHDLPHA